MISSVVNEKHRDSGVDITSVSRWLGNPTIYLADLEPAPVAALTLELRAQLDERVRDARQRGWEIG
jgi:hypothetical protein